jgi:hypothetical protein
MNETPSHERLMFAKKHGYKYVGNGHFECINLFPQVPGLKLVRNMTIHERINLRHNFRATCAKYSVFVAKWFSLRLKTNDFYTNGFFAFPYSNSVTFSPVK